jgi:hypothetical protein
MGVVAGLLGRLAEGRKPILDKGKTNDLQSVPELVIINT